MDALTGTKEIDIESFHESTVHGSPLLYDIDFDGTLDIIVATYHGEILAFKDNVRGAESGRVGMDGHVRRDL